MDELRERYKKIKRIGWIPNEWDVSSVEKSCEIKNNLRKPISEIERKKIQGVYPYYGPTKVLDYINECNIEGKNVLIGEDGDHFLKYTNQSMTLLVDGKYNVNNHAHILHGTDECLTEWIYHFFRHRNLFSSLTRQGAGRYKLTKEALSKLPIVLPSMQEQEKISEILSTWDEALYKIEALIEEKKTVKKGLMQQLLTGKKRLKGFENKDKTIKRFKSYLQECTVRNKDNQVKRVLSVTNSRGFIEQSEQFDRTIASADVSDYKIVKSGEFGYNPSRVNVGSIDLLKNFDGGLLSPMYVVFKTEEDKLLSAYLYQYFKSRNFYEDMKNYLQGSVRQNLNFKALCKMKVFIPSVEEQQAIANILTTADKEISLLEEKLEILRHQKKALMQNLLTGKVRVKI